MSPAANLFVAAVVAVVLALLLRPRRGLLWAWREGRQVRERIRIEDALKHCYDREFAGGRATVASVAAAVGVSGDGAAELGRKLVRMGLMESGEGSWRLTAEGRSYALRVIRIHRLWERYLADRTGLDPLRWHEQADRREHMTTPSEADRMSAELGNPCYDPHGDPIPTPAGSMPPPRGRPLTSVEAGRAATIVHVEDEPESVYAQLAAARLAPGVTVRVLENSPDRIRIESEMQEHVLAPVVAANLTVELVSGEEASGEAPKRRLSSLEVGQRAPVAGISPACGGVQRRRLLDLGLVPGTWVEPELRSAGSSLTAYRIRGAMVALRKEQADEVFVGPPVEAVAAGRDSGERDEADAELSL